MYLIFTILISVSFAVLKSAPRIVTSHTLLTTGWGNFEHLLQACFFNHFAATQVNGFSETLSLAENSLSLAKNSLLLTRKIMENLKFV